MLKRSNNNSSNNSFRNKANSNSNSNYSLTYGTKIYPLNKLCTKIGTSLSAADIRVICSDPSVLKVHLNICFVQESPGDSSSDDNSRSKVLLKPLGHPKTSPTFVNGKVITNCVTLKNSDQISFGLDRRHCFIFNCPSSSNATNTTTNICDSIGNEEVGNSDLTLTAANNLDTPNVVPASFTSVAESNRQPEESTKITQPVVDSQRNLMNDFNQIATPIRNKPEPSFKFRNSLSNSGYSYSSFRSNFYKNFYNNSNNNNNNNNNNQTPFTSSIQQQQRANLNRKFPKPNPYRGQKITPKYSPSIARYFRNINAKSAKIMDMIEKTYFGDKKMDEQTNQDVQEPAKDGSKTVEVSLEQLKNELSTEEINSVDGKPANHISKPWLNSDDQMPNLISNVQKSPQNLDSKLESDSVDLNPIVSTDSGSRTTYSFQQVRQLSRDIDEIIPEKAELVPPDLLDSNLPKISQANKTDSNFDQIRRISEHISSSNISDFLISTGLIHTTDHCPSGSIVSSFLADQKVPKENIPNLISNQEEEDSLSQTRLDSSMDLVSLDQTLEPSLDCDYLDQTIVAKLDCEDLERTIVPREDQKSFLDCTIVPQENQKSLLDFNTVAQDDQNSMLDSTIVDKEDQKSLLDRVIVAQDDQNSMLDSTIVPQEDQKSLLDCTIATQEDQKSSLDCTIATQEDQKSLLDCTIVQNQEIVTLEPINLDKNKQDFDLTAVPLDLDNQNSSMIGADMGQAIITALECKSLDLSIDDSLTEENIFESNQDNQESLSQTLLDSNLDNFRNNSSTVKDSDLLPKNEQEQVKSPIKESVTTTKLDFLEKSDDSDDQIPDLIPDKDFLGSNLSISQIIETSNSEPLDSSNIDLELERIVTTLESTKLDQTEVPKSNPISAPMVSRQSCSSILSGPSSYNKTLSCLNQVRRLTEHISLPVRKNHEQNSSKNLEPLVSNASQLLQSPCLTNKTSSSLNIVRRISQRIDTSFSARKNLATTTNDAGTVKLADSPSKIINQKANKRNILQTIIPTNKNKNIKNFDEMTNDDSLELPTPRSTIADNTDHQSLIFIDNENVENSSKTSFSSSSTTPDISESFESRISKYRIHGSSSSSDYSDEDDSLKITFEQSLVYSPKMDHVRFDVDTSSSSDELVIQDGDPDLDTRSWDSIETTGDRHWYSDFDLSEEPYQKQNSTKVLPVFESFNKKQILTEVFTESYVKREINVHSSIASSQSTLLSSISTNSSLDSSCENNCQNEVVKKPLPPPSTIDNQNVAELPQVLEVPPNEDLKPKSLSSVLSLEVTYNHQQAPVIKSYSQYETSSNQVEVYEVFSTTKTKLPIKPYVPLPAKSKFSLLKPTQHKKREVVEEIIEFPKSSSSEEDSTELSYYTSDYLWYSSSSEEIEEDEEESERSKIRLKYNMNSPFSTEFMGDRRMNRLIDHDIDYDIDDVDDIKIEVTKSHDSKSKSPPPAPPSSPEQQTQQEQKLEEKEELNQSSDLSSIEAILVDLNAIDLNGSIDDLKKKDGEDDNTGDVSHISESPEKKCNVKDEEDEEQLISDTPQAKLIDGFEATSSELLNTLVPSSSETSMSSTVSNNEDSDSSQFKYSSIVESVSPVVVVETRPVEQIAVEEKVVQNFNEVPVSKTPEQVAPQPTSPNLLEIPVLSATAQVAPPPTLPDLVEVSISSAQVAPPPTIPNLIEEPVPSAPAQIASPTIPDLIEEPVPSASAQIAPPPTLPDLIEVPLPMAFAQVDPLPTPPDLKEVSINSAQVAPLPTPPDLIEIPVPSAPAQVDPAQTLPDLIEVPVPRAFAQVDPLPTPPNIVDVSQAPAPVNPLPSPVSFASHLPNFEFILPPSSSQRDDVIALQFESPKLSSKRQRRRSISSPQSVSTPSPKKMLRPRKQNTKYSNLVPKLVRPEDLIDTPVGTVIASTIVPRRKYNLRNKKNKKVNLPKYGPKDDDDIVDSADNTLLVSPSKTTNNKRKTKGRKTKTKKQSTKKQKKQELLEDDPDDSADTAKLARRTRSSTRSSSRLSAKMNEASTSSAGNRKDNNNNNFSSKKRSPVKIRFTIGNRNVGDSDDDDSDEDDDDDDKDQENPEDESKLKKKNNGRSSKTNAANNTSTSGIRKKAKSSSKRRRSDFTSRQLNNLRMILEEDSDSFL